MQILVLELQKEPTLPNSFNSTFPDKNRYIFSEHGFLFAPQIV
jgi:hypothetical protein